MKKKKTRLLPALLLALLLVCPVFPASGAEGAECTVGFTGLDGTAALRLVNNTTGAELGNGTVYSYSLPPGDYLYEVYLEGSLYTQGGFVIAEGDGDREIAISLPEKEENLPPDEEEEPTRPGDGSDEDDDGDGAADEENPGYEEKGGNYQAQLSVDTDQGGKDDHPGAGGKDPSAGGTGGNGGNGTGNGSGGSGTGAGSGNGNGTGSGTGNGTGNGGGGSSAAGNGQGSPAADGGAAPSNSGTGQEQPQDEEEEEEKKGNSSRDRSGGETSQLHAMSEQGTVQEQQSVLQEQIRDTSGLSYIEVEMSGSPASAASQGQQKDNNAWLVLLTGFLAAGLLAFGMTQRGVRYHMDLQ